MTYKKVEPNGPAPVKTIRDDGRHHNFYHSALTCTGTSGEDNILLLSNKTKKVNNMGVDKKLVVVGFDCLRAVWQNMGPKNQVTWVDKDEVELGYKYGGTFNDGCRLLCQELQPGWGRKVVDDALNGKYRR